MSATKFKVLWEVEFFQGEEHQSKLVDYTRLMVTDFSDEVRFSENQQDLRVPLHLIGLRMP